MTNTTPGRSRGSVRVASALWYEGPGKASIRSERLPIPAPGLLTIETHYSGLSRGTESLVWSGKVPPSEWQRMRAPHQEGDFPFPVKYGYSATGAVVDGPPEWIGKHTFSLHPHQDVFCLAPESVVLLPDTVSTKRGVLAANTETALNALWDSGAGPGDRIVVVGAGIVGLLVAYLAARLPGTEVTVIDVAENRRHLVTTLGAAFHLSSDDPAPAGIQDADVVFHTSATSAGLNAAIEACGFEATLIELSWYGEHAVETHFGGAFHAKRLRLVSSQVGHVASNRRARWTHQRRLMAAIKLLSDPVLDCLVEDVVPFDALPERLGDIFNHRAGGVAPVIAYPAAT